MAYQRDYIIDVSRYITDADMAYIHRAFQPRPSTFRGIGFLKCERHERYTDGEQRISLLIGSDASDVVWYSAETAESLNALLHRPWSFAGRLAALDIDLEMQKMYLGRLPVLSLE